jgi:membrane protein implicated in regulation of membrane protease activity
MKKLQWPGPDEQHHPKHPYRDSALVYAGLAALIVVIAAVTGGNVLWAAVAAVGAFVIATAFSWWRWHARLRRPQGDEQ